MTDLADKTFDESLMKPWSIGVVAENKPLSTNMILVTPHEKLPFLDGQIKSNPTIITSSGTDSDGNSYQAQATADNTVVADWWRSHNSGRRTAPDVRRGERVQLYRYADSDKYYWVTLGLDDHLRKGETVIYTFSGTSDETVDGTKPGNCYSMEVSTHTGSITVATSKVNKEKAAYNIQLNTKDGKLIINDDQGNQFELDSINQLFLMINNFKTAFAINKQNIALAAPQGSIDLSAKDNITLECQNLTATVQDAITAKAQTVAITGTTTITGNTTIDGNLEVTGTTKLDGGVTFNGTVTAQVINCQKLNSVQPISAPNV